MRKPKTLALYSKGTEEKFFPSQFFCLLEMEETKNNDNFFPVPRLLQIYSFQNLTEEVNTFEFVGDLQNSFRKISNFFMI